MDGLKECKTITDMIFALEPLAYYCGITPKDFWNGRYREIYLYCETQFIKGIENFKQEIMLQEAATDKLIQADSMSKKPKIVPIRKMFKELFIKK